MSIGLLVGMVFNENTLNTVNIINRLIHLMLKDVDHTHNREFHNREMDIKNF